MVVFFWGKNINNNIQQTNNSNTSNKCSEDLERVVEETMEDNIRLRNDAP